MPKKPEPDGNFSDDLQTMEESGESEASGKPGEPKKPVICTIQKTLEDACIELSGKPGQDLNIYELGLVSGKKGFVLAACYTQARQIVIESICIDITIVKKDDRLAASERALAKLTGNGKTAAS